jgi:hypothetical protein
VYPTTLLWFILSTFTLIPLISDLPTLPLSAFDSCSLNPPVSAALRVFLSLLIGHFLLVVTTL